MDQSVFRKCLELINVKSHLTSIHSQENQVSYQVVYSNLEEDLLLNLQKNSKNGWSKAITKSHWMEEL